MVYSTTHTGNLYVAQNPDVFCQGSNFVARIPQFLTMSSQCNKGHLQSGSMQQFDLILSHKILSSLHKLLLCTSDGHIINVERQEGDEGLPLTHYIPSEGLMLEGLLQSFVLWRYSTWKAERKSAKVLPKSGMSRSFTCHIGRE